MSQRQIRTQQQPKYETWCSDRLWCSQVEKGCTAAVFGLGTIGLAVIDALQEAGAKKIIGIDTDPNKYERATKWGATECLNPKDYDKPIQVGPLWSPASRCACRNACCIAASRPS